MPLKKSKVAEPEPTPPQVFDFDNQESRLEYLKTHFDELLASINQAYGEELLKELLGRLERTVKEFDEQVKALIDQLKAGTLLEADKTAPAPTKEPETEEKKLSDEEEERIVQRLQARMRKKG